MGAAAFLHWWPVAPPDPTPIRPTRLEPFNRGVSRFNDTVDDAVLVPVATAYQKALPSMVRTGVNNFFGNMGDVWNLANSVAQLKLQNSAETFMRLNVNTFFGLGGLLDVATEAGHSTATSEDFGQTLGYWGVGPRPVRGAAAAGLLDTARHRGHAARHVRATRWAMCTTSPVRNSLYGAAHRSTRARNYLRASRLLGDAALDKYSFTRDAYLQRRRSQVYDGNPPDDGGR